MKQHVLVVDDSLIVRMDLRGALTAAGFEVTVCESKRAAEELLEQHSFSALILDVMLPDGDGVDILRRVRASAQHSDTPVVILSAEAEIRDRVRGLSMGADEYVGKPYNIAYFIGRVRDLCRSRRSDVHAGPTNIGSRRVLIVDDSPTFLEYLAQMLRRDGHDVVVAHSGTEALEMLAAQTIDCVVLDLHMPEVDGFATIRKVRQTPGRETTPIVMLTDSHAPTTEREALEAGADAFLHKSASSDVILAKLRKVLRGRRSSQGPQDTPPSSGSSVVGRSLAQDSPRPPWPMNPRGPSSSPYGTSQTTLREPNPLFVEATSALGLHPQLARDTLSKVLQRMRIDSNKMEHADLARALPALREVLQMFFAPEELAPRMATLSAIALRTRDKTR